MKFHLIHGYKFDVGGVIRCWKWKRASEWGLEVRKKNIHKNFTIPQVSVLFWHARAAATWCFKLFSSVLQIKCWIYFEKSQREREINREKNHRTGKALNTKIKKKIRFVADTAYKYRVCVIIYKHETCIKIEIFIFWFALHIMNDNDWPMWGPYFFIFFIFCFYFFFQFFSVLNFYLSFHVFVVVVLVKEQPHIAEQTINEITQTLFCCASIIWHHFRIFLKGKKLLSGYIEWHAIKTEIQHKYGGGPSFFLFMANSSLVCLRLCKVQLKVFFFLLVPHGFRVNNFTWT